MPSFSIIFGELLDAFNPSAADLQRFAELQAQAESAQAFYAANNWTNFTEFSLPPPPPPENFEKTKEWSLLFIYVGVAVFFLALLQHVAWRVAAGRQVRIMREAYVKSLLRQDMAWFDQHSATALVTRLNADLDSIEKAMGGDLAMFIQFMFTFLGGFAVGFWQGWVLSLMLLGLAPVLALSGAFIMKFMADSAAKGQEAYGAAGAVVSEALAAIRTVFGLGAERQVLAKYNDNLVSARKADTKKAWWSGLGTGVTWALFFFAYAASFRFGFWLVHNSDKIPGDDPDSLDDDYTGGRIMMVMFGVLIGAFALGQAQPSVQSLATARASAYHIFETIESVPVIDSLSQDGKKPKKVRGKVEIKRAKFAYPTRPTETILNGLSLKVEAGQTVALVGESGCGKSTSLALIQRLYDPASGTVLLDGTDVTELNVTWLRRQIGVVQQEPVLFAGTLWENIAYGAVDDEDLDVDDARAMGGLQAVRDRLKQVPMKSIRAAAKKAFAHDFIMSFPKQYDTYIGEAGAQLSGGQKQRVAIARAILKNPSILLLDEATSALDSRSEKIVQRALQAAAAGRTTIVIAHRLSTIRDADNIIVVDKGKVIEQGTHKALLGTVGSKYAALWAAQKGGGNNNNPESAAAVAAGGGGGSGWRETVDISEAVDASSDSSSDSEAGHVEDTIDASADVSVDEHGNVKPKKDEKEKDPDVPFARLAAMTKPDVGFLILGFIGAIINGAVMPSFALVFSEFIELFYLPEEEAEDEVNLWMMGFFLTGLATILGNLLQMGGFGVAGANFTERLRRDAMRSILHFEIGWFDEKENEPNVVAEKLATQTALVHNAVGPRMGMGVMNVVTVVYALGLAFYHGPVLTLVVLLTVPLVALGQVFEMKLATGMQAGASAALTAATATVAESVQKIRTTVAFTRERFVVTAYLAALQGSRTSDLKHNFVAGGAAGWSQGIMILIYGPIMLFGAYLADLDTDDPLYMDFGDVMLVFFAIVMMGMSFGQAASFLPDPGEVARACDQILGILDRKPGMLTHDNIDGEVGPAAEADNFPPGSGKKEKDDGDDSGSSSSSGDSATHDDFSWDSSRALANLKKNGISGGARIHGAAFAYPTRPDAEVFSGVNVTIREGSTVAFVGASGCGKSTMVALLQRFYDLEEGTVNIYGAGKPTQSKKKKTPAKAKGGKDKGKAKRSKRSKKSRADDDSDSSSSSSDDDEAIDETKITSADNVPTPDGDEFDMRDLPTRWVRQQIGIVGQEPVLFAGSIADNMRMGNPDLEEKDIIKALTASQAMRFIEKFEDGIHTQVGEKGAQLSGGQKQRIAIARAMARQPKLLLLDEATSALDSKSEQLVQSALDNAMKGRTTVVVAHRLSTVRNADQIIVMGEGGVVERGTHEELMAMRKAYFALVQRQSGDN